MTSTPSRPAREIAITARRTARDDPANYDSTAGGASTMDGAKAKKWHRHALDSHPGRPAWWPAFTKAMAGSAGAGALLFLADLRLLGAALAAGSAALWGLARIAAFYDNDIP